MQIEQVCRQSGDRRQTNRPEMRYMGIGVLDYTKSVYLHTNRNRLTHLSKEEVLEKCNYDERFKQ